MLRVAELVIGAALVRHESRGSHWRLDYQATDAQLATQHFVFQRALGTEQDTIVAREEVVPYV